MHFWVYLCFFLLLFVIHQQYRAILDLKNELSHDPLTGLKIMRHFERKCLDVMDRVERKRETSATSAQEEHIPRRKRHVRHSIAFVDLDGLQWTNNHADYGYFVGDRVLVALANILNRWKRQDDLIVRRSKGGDEFLIFLAGSTKEESERLLLENRRRFEKVIEDRFPGLAGNVSFSFGVREVTIRQSEDEIAEAIESASKVMHRFKKERKMDRRVSSLNGEES
jgi:diguanylate cyclase (GGDEF)-like protein